MARVAGCPKCSHDMLVPDEMDFQSWAKCPDCRAYFQLEEVMLRELPAALPAEPQSQAAETIAEDALSAEIEASEPVHEQSETVVIDEPADTPSASTTESDAPADAEEDLEDAAERIDKWFRSAKTVPETSPVTADEPAVEEFAESDLNDEIGLEESFEAPESDASWDDAQGMDQLLADIDTPAAEEPVTEELAAEIESPKMEEEERPGEYAEAIAATSAADMPVFNKKANGKPARKRSLVKTLTLTLLSAVVGLAAGYYALLWLRPRADFLNVAQYLPAAMLPAGSQAPPRQITTVAPPAVDLPDEETAAEEAPPEVPPADIALGEDQADQSEEIEQAAPPAEGSLAEAEKPTDTLESTEVQASFAEEDESPAADLQAFDDRYGLGSTDEPAAEEPAALGEPPAMPLAELDNATRVAEQARVEDAPSFTAEEVSASLETARQAQPSLITGSLDDSREVARAKGYSYSLLADLAQKVTFSDGSTEETNALFRQTLSDAHTRSEVAAILPKWIASPHRKHGGAFFAASLSGAQEVGSVVQYTATLESGQSLPVLVPAAEAQQVDASARRLGVVGWIVERPAENISGYSGDAQQAVWAGELISID